MKSVSGSCEDIDECLSDACCDNANCKKKLLDLTNAHVTSVMLVTVLNARTSTSVMSPTHVLIKTLNVLIMMEALHAHASKVTVMSTGAALI